MAANERCRNPRCNEGWVARGDNESGGAPAFRCRAEGCPYAIGSDPMPVAADRFHDPTHLADCDGVWPCSCVTRVEGIKPTVEMERAMAPVSAAVSPAEPPEADPKVRWSVSCGCDYHGDHMACDQACKDQGCNHPLGVEVTAPTEGEADARHGLPVTVNQSDIDAGREPARTMRQIASAVRQDTAGIGARLYSLRLILNGESIYGPVAMSDEAREALTDALDGLSRHLSRAEEKMKLAIEEEHRGR